MVCKKIENFTCIKLRKMNFRCENKKITHKNGIKYREFNLEEISRRQTPSYLTAKNDWVFSDSRTAGGWVAAEVVANQEIRAPVGCDEGKARRVDAKKAMKLKKQEPPAWASKAKEWVIDGWWVVSRLCDTHVISVHLLRPKPLIRFYLSERAT